MTTKMQTKNEIAAKLLEQNRQLLTELHKKSKNQTKSEIAQSKQKMQTKNVKDFIAEKQIADLDLEKRTVLQERRDYMLNYLNDKTVQVFNATMYRNDKNELELFTQNISDNLTAQFVAKIEKETKFKAQLLREAFKTCGGAYGDKIRKSLSKLSYKTTQKLFEAEKEAVISKALEQKKIIIQYDISDIESRRTIYEFYKI